MPSFWPICTTTRMAIVERRLIVHKGGQLNPQLIGEHSGPLSSVSHQAKTQPLAVSNPPNNPILILCSHIPSPGSLLNCLFETQIIIITDFQASEDSSACKPRICIPPVFPGVAFAPPLCLPCGQMGEAVSLSPV